MTTTNATNGQQRKTLAAQLDRLDSMLDGLSEGLNEAVAAAVRQGVAVGVQQAIAEVLTNADLQRLLHPPPPPPPPPPPAPAAPVATGAGRWLGGLWRTAAGVVGRASAAAGRVLRSAWGGVTTKAGQVGRRVAGGVRWARQAAGRVVAALLTRWGQAAAVSGAAGVACCLTFPALLGAVVRLAGAAVDAGTRLAGTLLALLGG